MPSLTYRAVGRTDGLDDIMQVLDGVDGITLGLSLSPETAALFAASATLLMVLRDTAEELQCVSRSRKQAGTVDGCDCWTCDRVKIIRAVIALATPEAK